MKDGLLVAKTGKNMMDTDSRYDDLGDYRKAKKGRRRGDSQVYKG